MFYLCINDTFSNKLLLTDSKKHGCFLIAHNLILLYLQLLHFKTWFLQIDFLSSNLEISLLLILKSRKCRIDSDKFKSFPHFLGQAVGILWSWWSFKCCIYSEWVKTFSSPYRHSDSLHVYFKLCTVIISCRDNFLVW